MFNDDDKFTEREQIEPTSVSKSGPETDPSDEELTVGKLRELLAGHNDDQVVRVLNIDDPTLYARTGMFNTHPSSQRQVMGVFTTEDNSELFVAAFTDRMAEPHEHDDDGNCIL